MMYKLICACLDHTGVIEITERPQRRWAYPCQSQQKEDFTGVKTEGLPINVDTGTPSKPGDQVRAWQKDFASQKSVRLIKKCLEKGTDSSVLIMFIDSKFLIHIPKSFVCSVSEGVRFMNIII